MRFAHTLRPSAPTFVASPANGSWSSRWVDNDTPGGTIRGELLATQSATLTVEGSNDGGNTIVQTVAVTGAGNPSTANIPAVCALYRVRYTNGGVADILPITASLYTVAASEMLAGALDVGGLTGAVVPSRWVGATAGGAPVAGTFRVGDFVIDATGVVIVCTVAGSPGTWVASLATLAQLTALLNGVYAPAASAVTRAQRVARTSGTITVNGTAWANLDTGLDLTLTATVGQWIEVGIAGYFGAGATELYTDVVSIVAAAPVSNWSQGIAENAGSVGNSGWLARSGSDGTIAGSIARPVVAGDLAGGSVLLRFRVRTLAATNKTLSAATTAPLNVWAINHG